ncbi:hypothetical protein [Xylophilus sp. Leaf220]|uniref:hypothetical protein n=1 Tax=Xylophilus sp. Leaf220 TaxID=1735686 RepID=UPI0006F61CF6|nr:hypothetical protein [Xylophilus sp. Leaf220]
MTYNERLAIAAHLHVLLRRITGRVTDVEWMAVNDDYALHIKNYSAQKAAETARPELVEWADKLFIDAKTAAVAPNARSAGPLSDGADRPAEAPILRGRTEKSQKYVGGLRM